MPLRIAAVAILGVLAILGVGSTARYAASLPKATPTNTNQSTQGTNPAQAPVNTQTNPTITPQNNSSSSSTTPNRCTTVQKAALTTQYNNQLASENARHNNVINFLTTTNAPAAAFAAENTTHSANINSINSQYQTNLKSIGC